MTEELPEPTPPRIPRDQQRVWPLTVTEAVVAGVVAIVVTFQVSVLAILPLGLLWGIRIGWNVGRTGAVPHVRTLVIAGMIMAAGPVSLALPGLFVPPGPPGPAPAPGFPFSDAIFVVLFTLAFVVTAVFALLLVIVAAGCVIGRVAARRVYGHAEEPTP